MPACEPLSPAEFAAAEAVVNGTDRAAIRGLQAAWGLQPDGIAGPLTRAALEARRPAGGPGGTNPPPGLVIVTRQGWGAKPFKGTPSALGTVTRLTIHHTATSVLPMTRTQGIEQARAVQRIHQGQGWADVGYHFLLDQAGTVYQGRAQHRSSDDVLAGLALGSHVGGQNTGNVGVSVMGYFHPPHNHRMSAAATDALRALVAALRAKYSVPASRVFGHRDLAATDCPGDRLYPLVQQLRSA